MTKNRHFEYGSPELWRRVTDICKRPSRMTRSVSRGLSLAVHEHHPKTVMYEPVIEWVIDEGGRRRKGLRDDVFLTDNLRRAIRTGRTDLEEVQDILAAMFGERARHAWDEPWRLFDEAVRNCGGRLSWKETV